MYNNIPTLQNSRRLTYLWVPTCNSRTPLACVWVNASHGDSKFASATSDEVGGMQLCA
jgi:hypothetical protein